MERRQVHKLAQCRLDLGIDPHRLAEPLAAVDDPVPDRIGVGEPVLERAAQLVVIYRSARGGQLPLRERLVIGPQQRQLDAARARIDDQDPQTAAQAPGQVQSRTSGRSSPTSRV